MYSPNRSNASAPAANLCHSNATPVAAPAASTIRTTAADTSGPIPSPGINVTACVRVAIASQLPLQLASVIPQRKLFVIPQRKLFVIPQRKLLSFRSAAEESAFLHQSTVNASSSRLSRSTALPAPL